MQNGQAKRGGLAGTRLGLANDVVTVKQGGNEFGLNIRGLFEAGFLKSFENATS